MEVLSKLNGWKKIIAAVAGVVLPVALEQAGVSREASLQVTAVFVAYLLGQGVADHGKAKPVVPVANWKVDPCSPDKTPIAPVRRTRKQAPVESKPMPVAPV
jgi:hypothetical protein